VGFFSGSFFDSIACSFCFLVHIIYACYIYFPRRRLPLYDRVRDFVYAIFHFILPFLFRLWDSAMV